jgi:hypothetical protein
MLPMELHGSAEQFVAFEWIGERYYLGERIARGEKRTRGANCTSADAAVLFEQTDGKRQLVLIEWKYTESYPSRAIRFSARGTDRAVIYRRFYEAADCPIDRSLVAHFDDLFYEPFYQLMRQQLLAREMEGACPRAWRRRRERAARVAHGEPRPPDGYVAGAASTRINRHRRLDSTHEGL